MLWPYICYQNYVDWELGKDRISKCYKKLVVLWFLCCDILFSALKLEITFDFCSTLLPAVSCWHVLFFILLGPSKQEDHCLWWKAEENFCRERTSWVSWDWRIDQSSLSKVSLLQEIGDWILEVIPWICFFG